MLNPKEKIRYSRHLLLAEIGIEGQEKLKKAKVLVIGAGGLGCPVLQYITAAGVGEIGIIDHDTVDESNLQRQILFKTDDVGRPKAFVAQRHLQALNPEIIVKAFPMRFSKHNALDMVNQYDIVVDGTDNFSTRYLINDACVIAGKPFVSAAIFKFEGQLSVFNYKGGPTYRCLFPEPPQSGTVPNCSEIGVLGVLPGIFGSMQANEVLKIIIGHGEPLRGKLLIMDTLSMQSRVIKFPKNADLANVTELKSDYELSCDLTQVNEISVTELFNLIKEKQTPFLVDVREEDEHDIFNIGGKNVPLSTLEYDYQQIPQEEEVVIYCKSGVRSAQAIQKLQDQFLFKNLRQLKGGIDEYISKFL